MEIFQKNFYTYMKFLIYFFKFQTYFRFFSLEDILYFWDFIYSVLCVLYVAH